MDSREQILYIDEIMPIENSLKACIGFLFSHSFKNGWVESKLNALSFAEGDNRVNWSLFYKGRPSVL